MDSKYLKPKYSPKYSADYCALKMPRSCSAKGLLDCTRSTREYSRCLWCCAPTIAYAGPCLRPFALTLPLTTIRAYAFSPYGGRSLVCRRSPTPTSTTSAGPSRRRCPSMSIHAACNTATQHATLQHNMQHHSATQHATFPQPACARATTGKRRARLLLWQCRTATSATQPTHTCNATQRNETTNKQTNKQTNNRRCAACGCGGAGLRLPCTFIRARCRHGHDGTFRAVR